VRDEACVQRVQRLREVRLSGECGTGAFGRILHDMKKRLEKLICDHEKYNYVKENTLQEGHFRYTICV
jgi:hypothetical protein